MPLMLNVGLILLLALLAQGFSILKVFNQASKGDTALVLFFLLLVLFLLDGLAVIIALVVGRKGLVWGFLLGGLLVFLVGLGACSYSLEHLNISTR